MNMVPYEFEPPGSDGIDMQKQISQNYNKLGKVNILQPLEMLGGHSTIQYMIGLAKVPDLLDPKVLKTGM